jgi:hypothetical protein
MEEAQARAEDAAVPNRRRLARRPGEQQLLHGRLLALTWDGGGAGPSGAAVGRGGGTPRGSSSAFRRARRPRRPRSPARRAGWRGSIRAEPYREGPLSGMRTPTKNRTNVIWDGRCEGRASARAPARTMASGRPEIRSSTT